MSSSSRTHWVCRKTLWLCLLSSEHVRHTSHTHTHKHTHTHTHTNTPTHTHTHTCKLSTNHTRHKHVQRCHTGQLYNWTRINQTELSFAGEEAKKLIQYLSCKLRCYVFLWLLLLSHTLDYSLVWKHAPIKAPIINIFVIIIDLICWHTELLPFSVWAIVQRFGATHIKVHCNHSVLQKRVIGLVHNAGCGDHTNSLFLKSKAFKYTDLVDFQTAQILYRAKKWSKIFKNYSSIERGLWFQLETKSKSSDCTHNTHKFFLHGFVV